MCGMLNVAEGKQYIDIIIFIQNEKKPIIHTFPIVGAHAVMSPKMITFYWTTLSNGAELFSLSE